MAGKGKPGPAKGHGGRPRKKKGSRLTKGKNKGYVKVTVGPKGRGRQKYLHRVKTRARRGQVVDHRDGRKSNNSRRNLRIMSVSRHAARTNKQRAARRRRRRR